MKYEVEIRETLSRTVTVDATSRQSAMEQVRTSHRDAEIVLDASDHVCTEFSVTLCEIQNNHGDKAKSENIY